MKTPNLIAAISAAAFLFLTPALHAQVTIDTVPIGNPNNPADISTGLGSVSYSFFMGTYDVTLSQYKVFLNTVAKSDPYGLYDPNMATDLATAGIARSGSDGSYVYSVIGDGQRPVTYVSWFDAARFANWLSNGQPTGSETVGTTETGAYALNGAMSGIGFTRNPLAQWWIPTENEWFKAAYYDPNKSGLGVSGYWTYATKSDTAPGNTVGSGTNQANYSSAGTTPVGAFSLSVSAYGTLDQSGNVNNWVDNSVAGVSQTFQGGSWKSTYVSSLAAYGYDYTYPTDQSNSVGFRVATSIPEPSTYALIGTALGVFALFRSRFLGARKSTVR